VGDSVRARVVTLSLNEREPRDSKIGLTMRQAGLGTALWLEEDMNLEKEKEKDKGKEKEPPEEKKERKPRKQKER
jgi:DNA-directed RNA polymerase subunit E'